MTIISSMAELESLAVGSVITAAPDKGWSKTGNDEWRHDGFTMPSRLFAEAVAAGQVTLGVALAAGQIYTYRQYTWHVIRENSSEAGRWWVVTYYRSEYYALESMARIPNGGILSGETVDAQKMALMRPMADSYDRNLAVNNRLSEALTRVDTVTNEHRAAMEAYKADVQTKLHAHLDATAGEDRDSALDRLLPDLGLSRREREITVTAKVSGQSTISVPVDALQANAPGGVTVSTAANHRMLVAWTHEYAFTKTGTDCACGQVTRGQVRNKLDESGISASSFSHETTCDGGGCRNQNVDPF